MIKFVNLIAITAAATAAAAEKVPVYYLIRHAEKNTDGTISIQGQQREQCLVKLFGKSSKYNIQHIMVQTPYPGDSAEDHTTQRPYNTTLPLAESLGITIDHPCNYTDTSCAGQAALNYTGPGNVLIAWEHVHLPAVSKAIGGQDVPSYPDSHFDLIYNQPLPYTNVTVTSEDCAAIGAASMTGSSTTSATSTTAAASSANVARQANTPKWTYGIVAAGIAALISL
ncbi:hypothetical protein MHUMG1_07573 [Metarhizium humberi]|uniref:Phosphoglycerate mutase family protein n=1 Tax=Metarhizium humberi TaxID=2596975 RepID=A0A9P8S5Y2_9HYPO|nr:hypothetical protein MHUMG1_07573 [Metarhizium humberi]